MTKFPIVPKPVRHNHRWCSNCGGQIYYSRLYKTWYHSDSGSRYCSQPVGTAEPRKNNV